MGRSGSIDSSYEGTVIVPESEAQAFPIDGMVTKFDVLKTLNNHNRVLKVAFQVWRPLTSGRLELRYQTAFYGTTNEEAFVVDVPSSDPIYVNAGDVVGLLINTDNPIPFSEKTNCGARDRIL